MTGLHLPAPHLIRQANPGAWSVECVPTVKSAVDTDGRHAMLPESHLVEDMLVQMHESEHIYRSSLPGCDMVTWLKRGEWWASWRRMVEEVAVDASHKARCGLNLARRHDAFDWVDMQRTNYPKDRDGRGLMFLQLCSHIAETTNDDLKVYWETMLAEMSADDKGNLYFAANEVLSNHSPQHCDDLTDWLVSHVFPPPPPPKPPEPQRETSEASQARQEAKAAESKAEQQADQAERKSSDADQTAEHLDRDASEYVKRLGADGAAGTAGNMRLDVHKHTGASMRPAMVGRTWRPTDTGSVIRYPSHYPSGMVFARRSRGGSILIDVSLSMHWDWEDLKNAMRTIPALWCGGYSGHSDFTSGYAGRLCIIAEAGRLGTWEKEREHAGINFNTGSDAASLAYMLACSQATPPYIWVSDGVVGSSYRALTSAVCRSKGVVRVASLTDAIALLQGRRVEQWSDCGNYAGGY